MAEITEAHVRITTMTVAMPHASQGTRIAEWRAWLEKHCADKYYMGWETTTDSKKHVILYLYTVYLDAADAMAFKLRFGL